MNDQEITSTLKRFERYIVIALLSMLMLAVGVATIELGVILIRELLRFPILLLDTKELLEVFGFFLMVLIGLELLETIKTYIDDQVFHVEVVFLVAMVAISRKVIILDYDKTSPEMLMGVAAVIIALAAGYYLVKRIQRI